MPDLSHLKEGDWLACPNTSSQWSSSGPQIKYLLREVTRTTPTQLICGNSRYHKATGVPVGGSPFNPAIGVTDEIRSEYEAQHESRRRWVLVRDIAEKLVKEALADRLSIKEQDLIIELFSSKLEK